MTKITNGRYSYRYQGVGFYVKLGSAGWLVDIGHDDIWEPAGATRHEAITYAQSVIGEESVEQVRRRIDARRDWARRRKEGH